MLDRLGEKRTRTANAFRAKETKRSHGNERSRVNADRDRFLRTKSSQALEMPRSNLPEAPKAGQGLAAYLGAHPVFTGAALATMGIVSFAGGAMGATLDTTLPADATNRNATPVDRSIVFVGMNADSKYEVQGLINSTGNQNVLTYIKSAVKPDVVKLGNVEYDLATAEGRDAFAAKIGLRGDRAAALSKVLEDTGVGARDEMAQLANVFAQAERGERNIERIVFSGHSVGTMIWGDGNGTINFSELTKLTAVFPRAAAQVQDVAFAACYTGGETRMDQYRVMFPNVKTIWAYDGSAPGSVSGAVPHLTRWERGTRGPSTDNLKREAANGTRKGENVAVWTVTRGYSNGQPPRAIEEVRAEYEASRGVVAGFQSGEQVVDNPGAGPLRDHYNHIQRMLSRRDLPQQERTQLEGERDLVIRLIYYKNASGLFQTTYKSTIETGFRELGMNVPDFSKLSRKEALDLITQFDQALAGKANPSRTLNYLAEILHGGLRDLGPQYIPNAWL